MGRIRGYRISIRCVCLFAHTFDISELGNDLWRQNPVNENYDYKLIHSRLQALMQAQENGDVRGLIYLIRSGTAIQNFLI